LGRSESNTRRNAAIRFSKVPSFASTRATVHVFPARYASANTTARSFGDVS
jgi:hypothetical protein